MEKPALLRAEIERALPELAQNPDKLTMFITNGRVLAGKGTLSHETAYTLTLMIADFSGDSDVLHSAIIHWLYDHQPDILSPGRVDADAYTFEADILSDNTTDLIVQLKLTERTTATVNGSGEVVIKHPRNANRSDLMAVLGAPAP